MNPKIRCLSIILLLLVLGPRSNPVQAQTSAPGADRPGFVPVDTVLVPVRRVPQLKENIRMWKGHEDVIDPELRLMERGRGYETPCPK